MANTWVNVTDMIWPIGSIYICDASVTTTPDTLFGGTWTTVSSSAYLASTIEVKIYRRTA